MHLTSALIAVVLAFAGAPAVAQYKIIGPDGRITYTDRPPADGSLKVTELGRPQPAAAPAQPLPLELRRLDERFPVALYAAPNCAACDSARTFLTQRGIPYRERLVLSNDDIAALARTVGSRTLPALTVGAQALSGFSVADWASYLDAAGYPRESQLPADWSAPTPTPLVARAPAASAPAATPPSPERNDAAAAPAAPEPAPGTIRF